MKEPPQKVSESVRKLNPHLYGKPDLVLNNGTQVFMPPEKPTKRTPKTQEERLNKTETEFLERLRDGRYGKMRHIGIQSITLQLGFDCRYTPDFWTRMLGGDFRLWEVKGFMRDDARVKLYTAARVFPFWTFVLVEKVNGVWRERIIEQ